jgi:PqqD family protein of HPr-rel-A system
MPVLALNGPLKATNLDDGLAVFNPTSWDTHLLNGAAAAVLQFIEQAPRTESEVTLLLEELLEDQSRPQAADHSAAVLAELLRLRLIRSSAA